VFEKSIGLRHHPAIILKIARAIVLPKSGFKDGFVGCNRNFVKHHQYGCGSSHHD
jgi:hypothetical protein